MQSTLMSQGLELLLFGMGTVVVFLTLLVFAIRAMSLLIQRFFPAPLSVAGAAPQLASSSGMGNAPAAVDPQLLAAIAGAVHQHRESSSSGPNNS